MAYVWKTGSQIKADPNAAGAQFEQLEKTAGVTAETVLNANKSKSAPLHNEFEWNNGTAAHLYRLHQSRHCIGSLCKVVETEEQQEIEVRAFLKTTAEAPYESINVIIQNEDKREAMLARALKELQAFMTKYEMLKELQPVREIMEDIIERI